MNVLSLSGVSKAYLDAPLFEDVTLGIDAGEKIGFIGRNGSGKSTFLKILSGEVAPDSGIVARNRELRVSGVEQRPAFDPGMSIDEYLGAGVGAGVGGEGEGDERSFAAARTYCRELGLEDTSVRMGTLSGGMVRKVSLARCLGRGAGFLTLDEPTNHLDLQTIEWLESLMKGASFGFVLVTHDRYFLDAVCSSIIEIEGRRITRFPGGYSSYLERKAERVAALERAEQRRSTILKRELEWLARGPKARRGKDKARTARVQDLLDTGTQSELSMREFSSAHRRLGKKVLELEGAAKSYDGRQVIRPFTYRFRRGERIGLIGPNGSGKTTFLGLVSGRLPPDGGAVVKGETTVFACFDQVPIHPDGAVTVLEYLREHAERIAMADGSSLQAEQLLERFLFPRAMQSTAIERLSGGELRRLELVRLLALAPNFLLLDEPTNDLDLDTIRLLEDYLADFPGCMIVVSHDRALLDRLTDYLFVFDGRGGIRGFTGSYADYRDLLAEQAAATPPPTAKGDSRDPARREKKLELSFRERRELEALEGEIAGLESERAELEALFQRALRDPEERARSDRRYREIEGLLEGKLARWEELASRSGN
jgi:ABC transport system ATP-binding/permease protein